MTEHHDALETRSPADREAALLAALPTRVAQAKAQSPAMAAHLGDVDAAAITSRASLARVPVLRKTAQGWKIVHIHWSSARRAQKVTP